MSRNEMAFASTKTYRIGKCSEPRFIDKTFLDFKFKNVSIYI